MRKDLDLRPYPSDYEQFLYAAVGQDKRGHVVTVLSMLARLGLDPSKETANLVASGHHQASTRLATLLERVRDIPALESDGGKTAQALSRLLPEPPASGGVARVALKIADGGSYSSNAVWVALAITLVLFQIVLSGVMGAGE